MEPDVVTCCSLVSALERGGQWRLAEQLFSQMCAAAAAAGDQRALLLLQRVGAGNAAGAQSQGLRVPLPFSGIPIMSSQSASVVLVGQAVEQLVGCRKRRGIITLGDYHLEGPFRQVGAT